MREQANTSRDEVSAEERKRETHQAKAKLKRKRDSYSYSQRNCPKAAPTTTAAKPSVATRATAAATLTAQHTANAILYD